MITDRMNINLQENSKETNTKPRRSLSYNDLKKKRSLRSDRSRGRLSSLNKQKQNVGLREKSFTEKKCITSIQQQSTAQRRPNSCYDQSNNLQEYEKLGHKKQQVLQSAHSNILYEKTLISNNKQQNYQTDRVQSQFQKQTKSRLSEISSCSEMQKRTVINKLSKKPTYRKGAQDDLFRIDNDFIKKIISKKKSQHKLLKYAEIRAQVKRSKSREEKSVRQRNSSTEGANVKTSGNLKKEEPFPQIGQLKQVSSRTQSVKAHKQTQSSHLTREKCSSRRKLQIKHFQIVTQAPFQQGSNAESTQFSMHRYEFRPKLNSKSHDIQSVDYRTEQKKFKSSKELKYHYSTSKKKNYHSQSHRKLKKSYSSCNSSESSKMVRPQKIIKETNKNKIKNNVCSVVNKSTLLQGGITEEVPNYQKKLAQRAQKMRAKSYVRPENYQSNVTEKLKEKSTEESIQNTELAIKKIESLIKQTKSKTVPIRNDLNFLEDFPSEGFTVPINELKVQPQSSDQDLDMSAIKLEKINISGIEVREDQETPIKGDSYLNIVEDLESQDFEGLYPRNSLQYDPKKYLPEYDLNEIIVAPSRQLKSKAQSKNKIFRKKTDLDRIHSRAFPKNFFKFTD